MADYRYDRILKYIVELKCEGPLHIGSANGNTDEVLVHPVDGRPFIQASSIAGVLGSVYKEQNPSVHGALFGKSRRDADLSDTQSRLRISDGIFTGRTGMELRPHVMINDATGIVDTAKFEMEYIGAGASFQFNVYLYEDSAGERLAEPFEMILSVLKNNELQFGAKKSSGAGKVSLVKVLKKDFNLKEEKGRSQWIEEDSMKPDFYMDITDQLPDCSVHKTAYTIRVKGKTEGAIQIRGIAVSEFGKEAPDSRNIQNAAGEFIVPGTSLKGAFRGRIEKIARFTNRPDLVEICFGSSDAKQKKKRSGCLFFEDVIIGEKAANEAAVRRTRIHIDKFTGGVMQQAMFCEQNAYGDISFNIRINKDENADAALALIVFALRDLSIGAFNLGSGYSIGKGFINIETITIQTMKGGTVTIFPQEQRIVDENGVLEAAMKTLDTKGAVQ